MSTLPRSVDLYYTLSYSFFKSIPELVEKFLIINLVQCLRDAEKKKVGSIDKKTVYK